MDSYRLILNNRDFSEYPDCQAEIEAAKSAKAITALSLKFSADLIKLEDKVIYAKGNPISWSMAEN